MHLSRSIECATQRVNPNVHYGLWVIDNVCQSRFIDYDKCTALMGLVDKRDATRV